MSVIKEGIERIYSSFKTGVVIWLFSYIMLYIVSVYAGDIIVYNENILKLLDVKILIAQILISGITYVILNVVLLHFADEIIKTVEKNNKSIKQLIKNVIISISVIVILLVVLYVLEKKNVISGYILKLMMIIIILKVSIFCAMQVINKNVYNKKLREKNME